VCQELKAEASPDRTKTQVVNKASDTDLLRKEIEERRKILMKK